MKPLFEKVSIAVGKSCTMLNRRLNDGIPFEWHYHPEYELTLTLNSHGQRFIGDHVEPYEHGDLCLIGPNLPHTWASNGRRDSHQPHVALVVWFRPEWVDGLMTSAAELEAMRPMLLLSGRGVRYSMAAAREVQPLIEGMVNLPAAKRLLTLLDVLLTLSTDSDRAALARADRRQQTIPGSDRPRIERVLDHIHEHYQERLPVDALAELVHLSTSGFHRLFQRHTRMTVIDYLIQLRIGRACQMLITTSRPIAHIATDVGFENLSHFNRRFRALKSTTPRAFRAGFKAR